MVAIYELLLAEADELFSRQKMCSFKSSCRAKRPAWTAHTLFKIKTHSIFDHSLSNDRNLQKGITFMCDYRANSLLVVTYLVFNGSDGALFTPIEFRREVASRKDRRRLSVSRKTEPPFQA